MRRIRFSRTLRSLSVIGATAQGLAALAVDGLPEVAEGLWPVRVIAQGLAPLAGLGQQEVAEVRWPVRVRGKLYDPEEDLLRLRLRRELHDPDGPRLRLRLRREVHDPDGLLGHVALLGMLELMPGSVPEAMPEGVPGPRLADADRRTTGPPGDRQQCASVEVNGTSMAQKDEISPLLTGYNGIRFCGSAGISDPSAEVNGEAADGDGEGLRGGAVGVEDDRQADQAISGGLLPSGELRQRQGLEIAVDLTGRRRRIQIR